MKHFCPIILSDESFEHLWKLRRSLSRKLDRYISLNEIVDALILQIQISEDLDDSAS